MSVLFHHFVPASLYGGETAIPTLGRIDEELRECQGNAAAATVAEKFKVVLYARLRSRFEPPQAQALTLKILNICLARYHFHARSASVLSRPYGLVVDPSDMCQLACPGCVHSERSELLKIFDWHKGTLPEDRFAALLKRYGPYAIGVYFCNYGEPLLNLNTPKLIRLAKNYLMGTALSTSLSVKRLDADAYVESGLDFMVLSIDGATQPVYERFRRNGRLELVFDNVRKLVEARRRLGKRTPVLSWNFLAFEHNAHEIPLASRMARKLGVDQFRVVNPFDVTWDDPEIRPAAVDGGVRRLDWLALSNQPENWNPFPEGVDADAIARAFERPWNPHAASDTPPSEGHTCHWLYKNMVMDATGRIMPCCGAPRPDANLVFATFDGNGGDPFNSEKYRQARSFFSGAAPAGEGDPYCARCEWDQTTVSIGGPEIRRYFRAADAAFFDRRSLRLLSGW
ncbi:MAG TPA: radical SAM/SPASM domain-containing protein [Bryobacteraceae bacterium]|nr:radical SAM/SPASM domain-containing protein [Bryobacteraceae bacterium]